MVQVYSCHHFSSQEVFTSQYEPLAVCSSSDLIFVATSRQTVETHEMKKKGCPLLCTFSTVGIVIDLDHSKNGNYVASLESKSLKHKSVTSARVYMNWARSTPWQPGRVRVAGHSLRNKKLSQKQDQFEVVEIPTFKSPNSIKCCSLTGNIVIGVDTSVCLFHLREQGSDKIVYDFEHLMNIDVGFKVINATLCCNYVACISQFELQIFKINFKSKNKTQKAENDDEINQMNKIPSFHQDKQDSFFVDDKDFVSWSFNDIGSDSTLQESYEQNSEFESLLAAVKLDNLSASKTCWMPSVQQEELFIDRTIVPIEILGPMKKVRGHPVKTDFPGNLSFGEDKNYVILTTLVYRRFESLNNEGDLHSLQFCATNPKTSKLECSLGSNELLMGLSCFVSTQSTGFLYEVHPCIQLIATYPYTAETCLVVAGQDLIHAVTKNGLETYTTRSFSAAVFNMEMIDDIVNTCPPAVQEPSLIGLRPFIGIFEMATAENHLIMLSKDSQSHSEGSWGVYVLKDAMMADLYSDIIDLASRYQTCNIIAYVFLLEQAHLFLRSAMFHSNSLEEYEMMGQYKETCKLLGDHYAGLESDSPFLAVPYYNMSGKTLSEIVRDQHETHSKQKDKLGYGKGLIQYLNYHLFDKPDSVSLDMHTAEVVLSIYATVQPDRLSIVILESKIEGYSLEGALELLENLRTIKKDDGSMYIPTVLDYICQAVIQLRLCEPDQARFLLNDLSEDDVIKVFNQRSWLLINEGQFSSLAQLMRQHDSKIFIDVLISLLDNESISLQLALQLFETQSSAVIGRSTHLMGYLEAILNARHRKNSYEQAAIILARIYVERLKTRQPTQQRMVKGRGHVHMDVSGYFGNRYGWLDDVLPFVGTEALGKPCCKVVRIPDAVKRKSGWQMSRTDTHHDKDCHCCCCYADLIKAQSLLCTTSEYLGPHKLILEAANTTDFIGSESLKLLCLARLDPGLASNYILENYPNLTVPFVKDVFGSDEILWTKFFEKLFEKMRTLTLEKDSNENLKNYYSILKGALDLAVSLLSHSVFMSVLPNDGALSFFLPYIERCCLRLEASKLRNSIAADLIAKTEMTPNQS